MLKLLASLVLIDQLAAKYDVLVPKICLEYTGVAGPVRDERDPNQNV